MPTLFDPIQLGDISAPNRIIMAPLTRGRAEAGHVPGDLILTHYQPGRAWLASSARFVDRSAG